MRDRVFPTEYASAELCEWRVLTRVEGCRIIAGRIRYGGTETMSRARCGSCGAWRGCAGKGGREGKKRAKKKLPFEDSAAGPCRQAQLPVLSTFLESAPHLVTHDAITQVTSSTSPLCLLYHNNCPPAAYHSVILSPGTPAPCTQHPFLPSTTPSSGTDPNSFESYRPCQRTRIAYKA